MSTLNGSNKFLIEPTDAVIGAPPPKESRGKPSGSAYAPRTKIYPKSSHGTFRDIKWALMAIMLAIYYILPWIRWDRGPGLPNQAFLLDFANQRLFFGPIQIWAQEFYYITGLLVVAALSLFLVTSIAGRMWCGYACPQTVWTDLMIAVERFWQGDRNAHMRRDQNGWTLDRIWRKFATHTSWLLIALATGGAFVFYFRDAPTLAAELATGTAPMVAYVFLGIFTATTYLLGGIAREQVCIYMCPWPRIQGAMLDRDSLFISYRDIRGEPRAAHKRGDSWEGRGDCIDCRACVAVCPTGIDIRDGSQLECIQCALCIDACNEIMDKVGRPRELIAYTTVGNLESATAGPRDGWRILRPRTILYSVLISLIGGLMLWSLLNRADLQMTVAPDRNPLYVVLSDGGIRNGYTVKIANKLGSEHRFKVRVEGLADAQLQFVEFDNADPVIAVAPADVRAVKLFVSLSAAARRQIKSEAVPLTITVSDADTGASSARVTTFSGPAISGVTP
jgi:cytochrome c oxidase accessory protein FixG